MTVCKIETLVGNNRMSTQELHQQIEAKILEGYTEFEIDACGQHDIACCCWNREGKNLTFRIKNAGQRVGAMGLENSTVIVENSASADVGWLNSGSEIIVNGNAGDTAGHCAAGGKIYIAGSVGTRSGALMKHDPRFQQPELWVLKNTGSFSFEFMGGGIAVICGYECDELPSILGSRSCVGMVGGTIYVRGNIQELADNVIQVELNDDDKEFLKTGMQNFLEKINKPEIYDTLTDFNKWTKIIPIQTKTIKQDLTVREFREQHWFEKGLFADLVNDNGEVYCLAQTGNARLHIPKWENNKCVECNLCVNNCPQKAIKSQDNIYFSQDDKCIGCGICSRVCPKKCWSLD